MGKHPAHYVGASKGEREHDDLYNTPKSATLALVSALIRIGAWQQIVKNQVWEPACGLGAISEVLMDAGAVVMSTDYYDHGYSHSRSQGPADFFDDSTARYVASGATIITNPPYLVKQQGRRLAVEDWIERAWFYPVGSAFFLLKTTALAGKRRAKVNAKHLYHVFQFEDRISFNGKQNMIDFAWFWYVRTPKTPPTISWINSSKHE